MIPTPPRESPSLPLYPYCVIAQPNNSLLIRSFLPTSGASFNPDIKSSQAPQVRIQEEAQNNNEEQEDDLFHQQAPNAQNAEQQENENEELPDQLDEEEQDNMEDLQDVPPPQAENQGLIGQPGQPAQQAGQVPNPAVAHQSVPQQQPPVPQQQQPVPQQQPIVPPLLQIDAQQQQQNLVTHSLLLSERLNDNFEERKIDDRENLSQLTGPNIPNRRDNHHSIDFEVSSQSLHQAMMEKPEPKV